MNTNDIARQVEAPGFFAALRERFDLGSDQAAHADIDATIRAGVQFRGTNLWLLIFAILIASIGLNVNSGAVIIGAMLISPLMGPILGVGYGAAVNDFALIRSAAKNLGLAVALSLMTSAAYFAVTPLSEARSEILARTVPTIWDVLIALFGGLAGMIGSTRREKSNVIPGVAIATALMPPLCTTGYGLATGQFRFAAGAFYLFSINSVFIATATLLIARVLRLPELADVGESTRARTRRAIGLVVFMTGIPSVWLAVGLVQDEVFATRAERFVNVAFPSEEGTFVVGRDIDPASKRIRVTLVGRPLDDTDRAAAEAELSAFGIVGAKLEILQGAREEIDVKSLRDQVASDVHRDTLVALDERNRRVAELEEALAAAEAERSTFADIAAELAASVPSATRVGVGRGSRRDASATLEEALLVVLHVTEPLPPPELERLTAWLRVRARQEAVEVTVQSTVPAARRP